MQTDHSFAQRPQLLKPGDYTTNRSMSVMAILRQQSETEPARSPSEPIPLTGMWWPPYTLQSASSHKASEGEFMTSNSVLQSVSLLLIFFRLGVPADAEPLPFRRAIQLAVTHSSEMAVADADVIRATQAYLEVRNTYIPQLTVGSNVGYAYGFPLSLEGSAPTLFNVTAQASVFNPAQREFARAAKAEWDASKTQGRNRKGEIILDTALTYIELTRWEGRLPILQSEMRVVKSIEYAAAVRIKEGIDSPIERTKARLAEAQTRVHIAQAEGALEVLRTRLSQLTGLPPSSIQTMRDSIPSLIENTDQVEVASRAVQASAAVDSAEKSAMAKQLRARGEHKALYPAADLAAQYGLINTSLTNFERFFVPGSFQPHNVTFGLVLRLPFFNASQKARATGADAEALRARKETEITKNKVGLDALKLQHDVQELSASRDVAQLRYELAQAQLDAVNIRTEAQIATQRELQNAAIEAAERTLERINADFELQRAELEMLRTTGELENWALSSN
jgi:outer membrane protein TolC